MRLGRSVLVLGPLVSALAALYLTYEGLLDEKDRSEAGIVSAFVVIIVITVMTFFRERTLYNRVLRLNGKIYDRLLALIGSLGEISTDKYEVWKIDLYLAHWRPAVTSASPFVARQKLIRQASADIIASVRLQDTDNVVDCGIVRASFHRKLQLVWFNPSSGHTSANNSHGQFNLGDIELATTCGAMRLTPVMSPLGGDPSGVLCVHTEPNYAALMSGTLETDEFARKVLKAAEDIHQIITDGG